MNTASNSLHKKMSSKTLVIVYFYNFDWTDESMLDRVSAEAGSIIIDKGLLFAEDIVEEELAENRTVIFLSSVMRADLFFLLFLRIMTKMTMVMTNAIRTTMIAMMAISPMEWFDG